MASTHPMTDLTVPKTQRAAVFEKVGSLRIVEKPVVQESELKVGQVLVKIMYSGVCHTDLHTLRGEFPILPSFPLVGGHEGAGFVVAIGAGTQTRLNIGQAVGVQWLATSCLNEPICDSKERTGYSIDGTFQQYTISYASHVTPIPESIPLYLAAPILCAGVTVYKAIKQANTQPGDIVVISGAGGGLGHLGIQYAVNSFGLRVIAIDTGDNKRELCQKLGAEKFVDFKTSPNVVEEVKSAAEGRGAHAVIVTSGSSSAYDLALKFLRPGGTLMAVGAPPGAKIELDVTMAISFSISVKASYIGNREDSRQALDIAARGRVQTTCRIEPLDRLPEVFDELQSGNFAGRFVLDLWK